MKKLFKLSQGLLEQNILPDFVIRWGIRELLKQKLREERKDAIEFGHERFIRLVQKLKAGPIALSTQRANEQHYELPTEFFKLCLGKHLKYSSAYWRNGVVDLDQAEADMLAITCERAALLDGQTILELGCGWGSLSLFMAEEFPKSRIVAVSNSKTQKIYIDEQARERGLKNLEIITSDLNAFEVSQKFDRVVSVEMFEHMHNYQRLLEKIAGFLKSDGKLFVHSFTHREYAYLYDEKDDADWIGRYFFTGGIMPSDQLLLYFQNHFTIDHHWRVSGGHYQKTAERWLQNLDANREKILPLLKNTYGESEHKKWWAYWRVFFMACAELWGTRGGSEWMVSHYRFRRR